MSFKRPAESTSAAKHVTYKGLRVGSRHPRPWVILCDVYDFSQKIVISTPFEYNFACFWNQLKEKNKMKKIFTKFVGSFWPICSGKP